MSSTLLYLTETSLLYATSDSVLYYVVPNGHPTNSTANTLHYFVNNSEKYFAPYVQLQFLPGKHYLDKELIVNNVTKLSLFGDATDNVTFYSQKTVIFRNSKNLSIKHLKILTAGYNENSGVNHLTKSLPTVLLSNCSDIVIQNSVFECNYQQCSLVVIDAMGSSNINNIESGQLLLVHNQTTSNIITEISYYKQHGCCDNSIKIIIYPHSYKIKINLSHITISPATPITIKSSVSEGQNGITIKDMKLIGRGSSSHFIDVALEDYHKLVNQLVNQLSSIDQLSLYQYK